jgi:hypothetical protein
MPDDYERTYFEVWGEMPPQPDPEASQPNEKPPAPEAAGAPAAQVVPAPGPVAPPAPPSPALAPADEVDRKANEVIMRMMVDTLRRVEARLTLMDEHQAENRAAAPGAAQALFEQLTAITEEAARFLQRTRKINEELAGIQIESARNLEFLARKVKELESRPLHWPPR